MTRPGPKQEPACKYNLCAGAVHVKEGRIVEVKPVNGEASRANLTHTALLTFGLKHILDYGDLVVAPGLIDTHVHMDQPGRTNWEGAQHA